MLKQWSQYIGIFGAVFLAFGFLSIIIFAFMGSASGSALFGVLIAQMVIGFVGVAIFLIYSTRDAFALAIQNKNTIFGIIGGIFLLGLLITANVASHTEFGHIRYDATKNKVHSLSETTLNTLENLPQKVEIVGFLAAGAEQIPFLTNIAERYTRRSDDVSFRIVDPDQNPALLQEYQAQANEILIRNQETRKTKKLTGLSEQDITTAIRRVISTDTKVIYFLQGHGEGSLDQNQETKSLSFAKLYLENEGYQVKPLNLTQTTSIPEDATIIVGFGASRRLPANAVEALLSYLDRGGSLVIGQDPIVTPTQDQLTAAGWAPLLEAYGLKFGDEIVVERRLALFRGQVASFQLAVSEYGDHPITNELSQQNVSEFSIAQPVYTIEGYEGDAKRRVLVSSSVNTWAESDIASIFKTQEPKPAGDPKGPLPLGQIAEKPISEDKENALSEKAKLVVFGDSDFATNQRFQSGFNRDVFLNVFNYLGDEERAASIRPKSWTTSTMELTAGQRSFVVYSSLFVIPQLIVLIGMAIWAYRRQRT